MLSVLVVRTIITVNLSVQCNPSSRRGTVPAQFQEASPTSLPEPDGGTEVSRSRKGAHMHHSPVLVEDQPLQGDVGQRHQGLVLADHRRGADDLAHPPLPPLADGLGARERSGSSLTVLWGIMLPIVPLNTNVRVVFSSRSRGSIQGLLAPNVDCLQRKRRWVDSGPRQADLMAR